MTKDITKVKPHENIIDYRRRAGQKKVWKLIDHYINNIKDPHNRELSVREIMRKFWLWNVTLNSYFGNSFKLVKNRKIYKIDPRILKMFEEIHNEVEKTSISKENSKIKKFLFAYLFYKMTK